MQTINFWPILVASIVSFGVSALWYSPIFFGKEWMSLVKLTDTDITEARSKGIWKLYIIQFIMTLVSFFVLAFVIVSTGARGGSNGAFMGFLVWLGFVATGAVSGLIWEKYSFKLMLIDTVSILVTLVIGGAIIGAWR
ncbi:MAG: DUF1761 domain-containing protein [Patescibacteria group bacterium]